MSGKMVGWMDGRNVSEESEEGRVSCEHIIRERVKGRPNGE